MKKSPVPEGQLSQVRSEELLAHQTWPMELMKLVEQILEIKLHTDDVSQELANFQVSYANLSEKLGDLLPVAIQECIEQQINFVHFTGFIDKEVVKSAIKEIKKRRKRAKH